MIKKTIVIVILVLLVGFGVFLWQNRTSNNLSDTEIRQKFDCDRLTREARQTDYYCSNPDAYRKGEPIPPDYLRG